MNAQASSGLQARRRERHPGARASAPRSWFAGLPAVLAVLALLPAGNATAQTPPGAAIANTARVSFEDAAGRQTLVSSNPVVLTTAVLRTPAEIEFARPVSSSPTAAAGFAALCDSGSGFVQPPLAAQSGEAPLLQRTASYNSGERVYLRVTDGDQNTDFQTVDYVDVELAVPANGDREIVRLAETGPDTGVFTGFLISSADNAQGADCVLQAAAESPAEARYADPADAADTATASAVFDPFGFVFDSRSGAFVDGVRITLVEAQSGAPATVFGNDGVSAFPATVVSGQTTVDASGREYAFTSGGFRFPSVPAGSYRLSVEPPDAYTAPSAISEGDLQALPGAPFDLPSGSFGASFDHDGNGPFSLDYPLDPVADLLFVQKSTATTAAAPGDFVAYEISVSNRSPNEVVRDVTVTDVMPASLRYVSGSATLDGVAADDPVTIAANELRFAVGDLDGEAGARLRYVAQIVSGQPGEELRNFASAFGAGGVVSNESTATLRLREDLFRSTGTLIGRVVEGDCTLDTFEEDRGVEGVRIYLEDGRYAVTDEGGRFHFEGLPTGTHVAQLDPATVPDHFDVAGCRQQGRFAGRGDSQLIELTPGTLRRANFYLSRQRPPEGDVRLSMRSSATAVRDRVAYAIELSGSGDVPIKGLQVSVLLPDGVAYAGGTLRVDGNEHPEPRIVGPTMNISLDDVAGDWRLPLSFEADIEPQVEGELVTQALASFGDGHSDDRRTPVAETVIRREAATWENAGYVLALQFGVLSAELSAADRTTLDALSEDWRGVRDIRITAVGHSDSTRITARSRHLFADNYALSSARAASAARYLAEALGVPESSIQAEGRGPDDPVASNDTPEGRQQNRRVELVLAGSRPGRQSFLEVSKPASGQLVTETRGETPGSGDGARQALDERALAEHLAPPQQPRVSLESLEPGVAWVTPGEEFRPAIPAMRVAIRHAVGQSVSLFVNGLEVDPVNFAGTDSDGDRDVAISRWSGVKLLEGSNLLVADIVGPDGLVAERLTRSVHYAGTAVRAELVDEASVLVADGKTRPVLAVRLFDRFGEPARHSSVGEFSVDAPYRSWWEMQRDRENQLVQLTRREALYTVGDDGIAYVELAPTTESGQVNLHLRLSNQREQELTAWLKPAARDWILVGFGEGTLGYTTLSRNSAPAASEHEDGYYEDGRLAFFAKGSIRGDYLLTLAYDSARDTGVSRQGFQSEIDPNAWYTIYADNTEQRFEAASQRRLYVKLEREQFNALFGDFSTGLSITELTRYERRMNGFRSEYSGRNLAYTAFASDNNQSLVRDEIQGDGTSGLYRLSAAPLIAQSEVLRIEVRDRFDQSEVVSTRTLTRFLDYSLDPIDGTVYFKQPVPSRDESFNPVFIIAEYETRADVADDLTAGGRVALRSGDRRIEAGVTHINERQPARTGELSGVDLRWQVSSSTLLRAEHATSSNRDGALSESGRATAVALEHRGEKLDLQASFAESDQDFGLGNQPVPTLGIRKLALDARYDFNTELSARAEASLQDNLESGAERMLTMADVEYRNDRTTATVGFTRADDRFVDGERRTSNILDAGVSRRLFDSALSLRANGSLDVGGDPESADFPTSYVFGVDYTVRPEVDLFLQYENAEGADIDAEMTRVGVRASPWSRAQMNTSVSNEMSEFGPRLYSNLGLVQGFQLNDRWMLDVGVDQTQTLRDPGLANFDEDRELASGSNRDDFATGYVGTLYQSETWSVNSRIEYRHADTERRTTFLSGWFREPSLGHALSAGMTLFHSNPDDGRDALRADLSFGWAMRRAQSRWAMLYRADLIMEQRQLDDAEQSTWRVVSNLNTSRRLGPASELGLQYAAKYVRSHFDGFAVDGYTDLIGADLRRGFAGRWELAAHTSLLHSWRASTLDYGAGLSLGYNLADDLWVSVGYNAAGFRDDDFAGARYTAAGPFLTLVARGHQSLLKRIARR